MALKSTHYIIIMFISIFVGLLALGGLIALGVLWQKKLTPFQDYALVVDAGSTHSKIFIYTWPADKSDGLGLTSRVTQHKSCGVPGGPITSIKNPSESTVKAYFESTIMNCTADIPSSRKSRTMIYLGGTAGLRLFEIKSPSYTHDLLASTRTYFGTLGLHFKSPEQQVRIINGSEEGLSGWITANMLMGKLFKNDDPGATYGVSDMGGASTQISFFSPNASANKFDMNLFKIDYQVYSHSFLCYGTEQLRLIHLGQLINNASGANEIEEPCLQRGFVQNISYDTVFGTPCARGVYAPISSINTTIFTFKGTSDPVQCSQLIKERFDKTVCNSQSCSFNDVYQPLPISPSVKFIAISAWFTTFRNVAPNVTVLPDKDGNYNLNGTDFGNITSAINSICSQAWADVPSPDQYRPFLCFNSMYHWTLLQYGYSMTNDNLKNFQIIKTINSNEIGWTLGYMINQTNYLEPQYRPERLLTKSEFGGLLFLCAFVLLVCLVVILISIIYYKKRQNY